MNKVCLVTLGCAKNTVDSEIVLGMLDKSNFEITSNQKDADLIIVNTCGFINDSKQESINAIFEQLKFKKKLVVIGCLVERYYDELVKEIPEVDLFVKIKDYFKLNSLLSSLFNKELKEFCPTNRVLSTPNYQAYLRISEGCNNCCTYCAIPLIRGSYRSRPVSEILEEARDLKQKGIKELVIISQDVTRFGSDFSEKYSLVDLLKELVKFDFYSIRLLYLYPDEITDELIDYMIDTPSIANYFDIPIQHASDKVLQAMNRRGKQEELLRIFNYIKTKAKNAILRTTLIVGFPGENKKDFEVLKSFVSTIKFDHLGCFQYSREEGTKSFDFPNQIRKDIKEKRYNEIMSIQEVISYENNKKHIGEEMEGIVIGYNPKEDLYYLRSYYNAPDDIDGDIMFDSNEKLNIGDIVKVKITNAFIYELFGEKI